ncbi:PTS transporter subunit EIIC [Kitasatospora sp. NPDC057198]|uniref:PTS transporter subunit EIIC n=1 Tax=Kitasatospora sp. NPDC057198 TaxID=3346046 RepID=UPI00363D0B03
MSTTAQNSRPAAAPGGRELRSRIFAALQKIGRSLQLPIAVLPAAGILLRLGREDVFGDQGLGWDRVARVFSASGHAVFDWMPLLFCVGIAIGYAKKSDGSTALAALVGFLTYHQVLTAFPKTAYQALPGPDVEATYQDPGVLGGVVVGLLSAVLWQRLHRARLVDWLGFFNGRRLVPIVMAFVGTALGVLFGLCWGPIGHLVDRFSEWAIGLGAVGSGIFGLINRALLPFGLHQFANTFFWQQAGTYTVGAQEFHGDQTRFFQHDLAAGQFMSGFFPIMMFGLPAAALAIAHCARPERRRAVLGMMFSLALTSFVTGITEPIEFSFLFIAPVLYALHAVLTGLSMALTWALGVHHGFTFSAGAIDYVLNWNLATEPWRIVPIGLCFAAVYYTLFRFVILRFDLKTPGRGDDDGFEDG